MRKLRLLWLVWLVLAAANLLLVNVYLKHLGTPDAEGVLMLSKYQQLGYLGLTLLFTLLVGVWWIAIGKSRGGKLRVFSGTIVTVVAGLGLIGAVVYGTVFDGSLLTTIINRLAQWFSFIKF